MLETQNPVRSDRSSWLYLAAAAILLLVSGGRWDIPLAVWLTPVFLLRFVRTHRPLPGLLLAWLVRLAVALVVTQGIIPFPGVFYYVTVLLITLVTMLPYLADRLLTPRLNGYVATLVFPLAYTTLEFLSSFGSFGAFTSMANTQVGNLPLIRIASVTGLWGITFLITWFASVVSWAWAQGFALPAARRGVLLYAAVLSAVLLAGGARLAFFPPQGTTVRVVGLSAPQAAVLDQNQHIPMQTMMALTSGKATPADQALARSAFTPVDDALFAQSQQEARAGAKIVVWPEVGASLLQADEPAFIQRAGALAKQEGIYLDIGLAVFLPDSSAGASLKDETVLLDPSGNVVWTYEKTHLVPFEETGLVVPGDGKLPWVDTPYGRLANAICFDLDFPPTVRQAGQSGAALMLAPSNDWQAVDPSHTHAAVFRAIENGFSLVRQASHGLSIAVDFQGHVLAASDYFTTPQQVLVAYVPTRGVRTLYSVIGDLFAWLCLLGLLTLITLAIVQTHRRRSVSAAASLLE